MTDEKHPRSAIYAGMDEADSTQKLQQAQPCDAAGDDAPREGAVSPSAAGEPGGAGPATGSEPSAAAAANSAAAATATAPEPAAAQQERGAADIRASKRGGGIKAAIAIIAVASVAIIGVSVFALAGGFDAGDAAAPAVQQEAAGDADAESSSEQDGQQEGDAGAAEGADDAADAADGASDASGADAADATGSASADASAQAPAASQSEPAPAAPQQTQPATITVSVTADGGASGASVSYSTSVTVPQGATVFDALAASGIPFNARSSAYGMYVDSIGGVSENYNGTNGGWTYYVNGSFINSACDSTVLSAGDSVRWTYVLVQ